MPSPRAENRSARTRRRFISGNKTGPARRLEIRTAEKRPHRRNEPSPLLSPAAKRRRNTGSGRGCENIFCGLSRTRFSSIRFFLSVPTSRFRDGTPRSPLESRFRFERKAYRANRPRFQRTDGTRNECRKQHFRPPPAKGKDATRCRRNPHGPTTEADISPHGLPPPRNACEKENEREKTKNARRNAANGPRHDRTSPDDKRPSDKPALVVRQRRPATERDKRTRCSRPTGTVRTSRPLPAMPRRLRYRATRSAARSAQRSPSMAAETMPPA